MERVALKIQRRRKVRAAVYETFILLHIVKRTGPTRDIVALHEAFLHDGVSRWLFRRATEPHHHHG